MHQSNGIYTTADLRLVNFTYKFSSHSHLHEMENLLAVSVSDKLKSAKTFRNTTICLH